MTLPHVPDRRRQPLGDRRRRRDRRGRAVIPEVAGDRQALAWAMFFAAATTRPTKETVAEDAIRDDATRADRMLREYETRFPRHP
jgi:hypothetical protein